MQEYLPNVWNNQNDLLLTEAEMKYRRQCAVAVAEYHRRVRFQTYYRIHILEADIPAEERDNRYDKFMKDLAADQQFISFTDTTCFDKLGYFTCALYSGLLDSRGVPFMIFYNAVYGDPNDPNIICVSVVVVAGVRAQYITCVECCAFHDCLQCCC